MGDFGVNRYLQVTSVSLEEECVLAEKLIITCDSRTFPRNYNT